MFFIENVSHIEFSLWYYVHKNQISSLRLWNYAEFNFIQWTLFYLYQYHIENNWINAISKVYGGQCIYTAFNMFSKRELISSHYLGVQQNDSNIYM